MFWVRVEGGASVYLGKHYSMEDSSRGRDTPETNTASKSPDLIVRSKSSENGSIIGNNPCRWLSLA